MEKLEIDESDTKTGTTVNLNINTNQIANNTNSSALTGGIIGIIAFVLGWIPLAGIFIGWPLGVLAIIFSGIGLSKANQGYGRKELAIVGLILGIVTVIAKSIPGVNLL